MGFARGRRKFCWVCPRDRVGKGSRLLTAGREWDGNVGSPLVHGTGWEYTISWRNRIVERVGNRSRNDPETYSSRENGRGHAREHNQEIGRERCGISTGDAVRNGWEHDRERGPWTTVEKKREMKPSAICYLSILLPLVWSTRVLLN